MKYDNFKFNWKTARQSSVSHTSLAKQCCRPIWKGIEVTALCFALATIQLLPPSFKHHIEILHFLIMLWLIVVFCHCDNICSLIKLGMHNGCSWKLWRMKWCSIYEFKVKKGTYVGGNALNTFSKNDIFLLQ